MCTPKIISSFSPCKVSIIIIKTSVTFLLVNRLSVCTRQTDCQLSVHTSIIGPGFVEGSLRRSSPVVYPKNTAFWTFFIYDYSGIFFLLNINGLL